MAHKFAEHWTSWLFINNQLRPNGKMDLTKMDEQGDLADGEHDHNGSKYKISGKCSGDKYLHLDSDMPVKAELDGVLVHECGETMIVVGKKNYIDKESARLELTTGQDDPPWVLTKP
ncbi:MAG TPA: hypothetical protein VJV03_06775 [Pyrinomonadaceae bacterium]|nr:hypothetical protein [Pyrinomonadaceae bacterium]